jgi:hypothetical protein
MTGARLGVRAAGGQASLEAVALLPLLAGAVAAVMTVFAAGAASEAADAAAHSAAVALLQGGDPREAARAALDGWPRSATRVEVSGGRVAVTVRPRVPVPVVARALEARTVTDAGTAPARRPAAGPAPAREPRGGDGRSARVAPPREAR